MNSYYDQLTQHLPHLTFMMLLQATITTLLGVILANAISYIFKHIIANNPHSPQLRLLKRILFYGILALFILMALQQLGMNLNILLGAAGILTVALGFASQTSATNFISGIFLVFDKAFKVGDTIKVNGFTGKVINVETMSIKLATADNQYVRIPNEMLIKNPIINVSYFDTRRYDLIVRVDADTDINLAQTILLQSALEEPMTLETPEPSTLFMDFTENGISLRLSAWVKTNKLSEYKNQLAKRVQKNFSTNDIQLQTPIVLISSSKNSVPETKD